MSINKLAISERLVQELISSQFPCWQNLVIKEVEKSGHDNRASRLGDFMCVRLPSALSYASQVEKEFEWLPQLAKHVSISITEPLVLGKPDTNYPYSWSINKYLEGETLELCDDNKSTITKELASFL
ncbi:MAG: phosphotransferase [Bacteroidales bacterium]